MIFNVYTLFPEFFESPLNTGLTGKSVAGGIIKVELINIRDYSEDKFKRCDDYSYGGGSGMILKPEPVFKAIEARNPKDVITILTSPGGRVLDQDLVKELSAQKEISIVCGNYEGVDERIVERYIDYEISVGDYILSGGEFAALIIMNTLARYVPGFMSNSESLADESFEQNLLEYPQYTRPQIIDGMAVPDILLSGNHESIRLWREKMSIEKTKRLRPDLYKKFISKKQQESTI